MELLLVKNAFKSSSEPSKQRVILLPTTKYSETQRVYRLSINIPSFIFNVRENVNSTNVKGIYIFSTSSIFVRPYSSVNNCTI